jgi:glycerol-3-phosphate dehydrogenase
LISSTSTTYPKLEQNATTDVLVVGGGIAGLHIAYELLQSGKKVIVVEDGSKSPKLKAVQLKLNFQR